MVYPPSPAVSPRPELSTKIDSFANAISRFGVAVGHCISSLGFDRGEAFSRLFFAALLTPPINQSTIPAEGLATDYALPTHDKRPWDRPTHPRSTRALRMTHEHDTARVQLLLTYLLIYISWFGRSGCRPMRSSYEPLYAPWIATTHIMKLCRFVH